MPEEPPLAEDERSPERSGPRESVTPGSIEAAGARIHYVAGGDGEPPLLLLHGFGAGAFSWDDVIAPIASRHRVVAFDRPGFGESERPPGVKEGEFDPYSLAANERQALALLDHLAMERVVIVGHSAGSVLGVHLALTHPERVVALVLEDPALFRLPPRWLPALAPALRAEPVRRAATALVRRFERPSAERLLRRAFSDQERLTPERIERYLRPLEEPDSARGMWELSTAERPTTPRDKLQGVAVPTLVIAGAEDRVIPVADAKRAAEEVPGARLVLVPECGHVPHEERPAEFLEALFGFLGGPADDGAPGASHLEEPAAGTS